MGFQRIARSWLYSGMAMRLCFDLGLHVSTASYVEHSIMSALEAAVRQMTFWQCYVQNYRMSFSLGRPFTLDASEITAERPGTFQSSYNTWRTYPPLTNGLASHQSPANSVRGSPDLIGLISENRIILCDLVEPVARALYGNTRISFQELLDMSEKATSAMFSWKENLPEALRVAEEAQSDLVPQLLVLHLEYQYLYVPRPKKSTCTIAAVLTSRYQADLITPSLDISKTAPAEPAAKPWVSPCSSDLRCICL